jgi:DNA-binding winged helix-turn-helix (wHTH) protein
LPADAELITFGQYRLHPTQGLLHGESEVRVTPKALAVLYALACRPRQIVTKAELFRAVWPTSVVTDAALSSCIRELRRALNDDAREPRYIETVHRRGFRLLQRCAGAALGQPGNRASPQASLPGEDLLVGREPALTVLTSVQKRVLGGTTHVAFIEGEEGIGKTSLVHAFVAGIARRSDWRICRGHCLEESGGSAYQPLLEALGELCLQPGGAQAVSVLRNVAPTWLAELSFVLDPAQQSVLRQTTSGVTPLRFLRELRDALVALSATRPLLLVLEDLQWSDSCTLEWIESIARTPAEAPVLLVATRTESSGADEQPGRVKGNGSGELDGSTVLRLGALDRNAVSECLRQQYPGLVAERNAFGFLADALERASGGNPLLLKLSLDELAVRGVLVNRHGRWMVAPGRDPASVELPREVERLLEKRRDRLSESERRVLEAASVAGTRFSSAEAAAGADMALDEVEDLLDGIVRAGDLAHLHMDHAPDDATNGMFQFRNTPLRRVLLDGLSPSRHRTLHYRIGRRLEKNGRACEMPAELAIHFEQAYDIERAIAYRQEASAANRRRGAHRIAQTHLRRALVLLEGLPESLQRDALDAQLRIATGSELIAAHGFGTAEIDECYERAFALQENMAVRQQQFEILWRLWVYFLNRGPLAKARQITDRLSDVALALDSPSLQLDVHHAQWGTALMLGEIDNVLLQTRQGMALCGGRADSVPAMVRGCTLHDAHLMDHHAAVCAGFFAAWADGLAGRTDNAKRTVDGVVTHARDVGHPYSLAVALVMSAAALAAGGDAIGTRRYASEAAALAKEDGFDTLRAWAQVYEGWAAAQVGDVDAGIRMMRAALDTLRNTALWLFRPFQLSLAAQIELANGMFDRAAESLKEAFAIADRVGDRLAAAELHRLRGELNLATCRASDSSRQAQRDFQEALEIATAQGAHLVRSRVLASLARL